jgi:hypothetical protein
MIVQCVLAGLRLDWSPIRTIYAGTRKSHIQPLRHLVKSCRLLCGRAGAWPRPDRSEMDIQLRPIEESDREFLWGLHRAALKTVY